MSKRLLDKNNIPSMEDMLSFCNNVKEDFVKVNDYIKENCKTTEDIAFPYGNNYGWCISHHNKKKLICNLFPEENSFCMMIRCTNSQFESIYTESSDYLKDLIDHKYPCGNAGWIHYHYTNVNQMDDVIKLINQKEST